MGCIVFKSCGSCNSNKEGASNAGNNTLIVEKIRKKKQDLQVFSIVNEIIELYRRYDNSIGSTNNNNHNNHNNNDIYIVKSQLYISIARVIYGLKYIDANLQDIYHYKKRCLIAALFLANIGIVLQTQVFDDKVFCKHFNVKKMDIYELGKVYLEYMGMPYYVANMVGLQINFNRVNPSDTSDTPRDAFNISHYIDAELVNKIINECAIANNIIFTNDEKKTHLSRINTYLCETILI